MASNETVTLKLQTLGWEAGHSVSYHTTLSSIFAPLCLLGRNIRRVLTSQEEEHTVALQVYIRHRWEKKKKNLNLGCIKKNSVTTQCVVDEESRDQRPYLR